MRYATSALSLLVHPFSIPYGSSARIGKDERETTLLVLTSMCVETVQGGACLGKLKSKIRHAVLLL